MLSKDFENFELRLQKLREEQSKTFKQAEKIFRENFEATLQNIFPRDILGIKKTISSYFLVQTLDTPETSKEEIFRKSLEVSLQNIPLHSEEKQKLFSAIVGRKNVEISRKDQTIRSDSMFPIIEDLAVEGLLSKEEFILLEKAYIETGNIYASIEVLPKKIKDILLLEIEALFSETDSEKEQSFRYEYSDEIHEFEKKSPNAQNTIVYVSKYYYKNPGKYRKRERPYMRTRRTFKIALLKLLSRKYGSFDAVKLLDRFENCETFGEMMSLIYELFEILGENDEALESYQSLEEDHIIEKLAFTAEERKKKILEGEKITTTITELISDTDSRLEEGMLEKVLDDDTHFHGEEIHFEHGDDMVGVYSESNQDSDEDEDEEEEDENDVIDESKSLRANYEALKEYFIEVTNKKQQLFAEGNFEAIDTINMKLGSIQSKIEKLAKLLGEEI